MRTSDSDNGGICWHCELPPFDAKLMGEYVLEAISARVRGSLAHRGELWDRAYQELMERTEARMKQEIGRRGRVAAGPKTRQLADYRGSPILLAAWASVAARGAI